MSANPNFAATPKVGKLLINTANTNRDGTGVISSIFAAGASGSRIDKVVITANGTTTAGMIRLYISNGVTATLILEIPVTAITPSGIVQAFVSNQTGIPFPLVIPSGYSLQASTNNAEAFIVTAFGGDFKL